jgi:hypothetical protein
MCPFCLVNLGLIVAGTVSTGGLAALAVKISREKKHAIETNPHTNERNDENGDRKSR